jgi:hypothetical protein
MLASTPRFIRAGSRALLRLDGFCRNEPEQIRSPLQNSDNSVQRCESFVGVGPHKSRSTSQWAEDREVDFSSSLSCPPRDLRLGKRSSTGELGSGRSEAKSSKLATIPYSTFSRIAWVPCSLDNDRYSTNSAPIYTRIATEKNSTNILLAG